MSEIQIQPVRGWKQKQVFLTFPWKIYRGDPLWVPPILKDRAQVIDHQRGLFFQHGEAEFFIAWKDGIPVGTICAAEDRVTNQARGRKECMFGFFECYDDEKIAIALFDMVKKWAKQHSLDTLFGPFNLDYEDGYGVLIEGRDRPPALLCGHTPPYYAKFFDQYGFVPARGDNLAYAFDFGNQPIYTQLAAMAKRVRARTNFAIRSANFSDWDAEIKRVFYLLNTALAHLPDFIPWQLDTVQTSMEPFRKLADPDLILFADFDDQTIGFFPGVPNFNEILIHANGLRYPWDYLSFAWRMRHRPKCLAVKSVLVIPEYWGSGVAILLFDEMARRAKARNYQWADLSLTSADNPRTPVLAERLGAKLYKRYRTYRLPVDG